jgi:hypothetical protein
MDAWKVQKGTMVAIVKASSELQARDKAAVVFYRARHNMSDFRPSPNRGWRHDHQRDMAILALPTVDIFELIVTPATANDMDAFEEIRQLELDWKPKVLKAMVRDQLETAA